MQLILNVCPKCLTLCELWYSVIPGLATPVMQGLEYPQNSAVTTAFKSRVTACKKAVAWKGSCQVQSAERWWHLDLKFGGLMHSGKKGLRAWEVSGGPYTQNPVTCVRVPPVVNKGGKSSHTNPHVVILGLLYERCNAAQDPSSKVPGRCQFNSASSMLRIRLTRG